MTQNIFKWGPLISETIEQSKNKEELWKKEIAYNIPKQNLYWTFTPSKSNINYEKIDNTEEKTNINSEQQVTNKEWLENKKFDLNKFKENPNYPILERFTQIQWRNWEKINNTQLSNDNLLEISKILQENWWKNSLDYLKSKLNTIDFKDKKTAFYLWNYIDKVKLLNKWKKEETLDDWEKLYSLPKEFKDINILNNQKDDIVQLLIKNYTKLPNTNNWEPKFEKDILTTFEITANKIIEWKNFPRNESFDLAMRDIKNGDLETRYNALSYINSLVNTLEWIKWLNSKIDYKKNHELKKQDYLDFKILKLNKELIELQNKWDNIKAQELKQNIIDLEWEKNNWDIFEAWELDKIKETEPEIISKI